ncbi:BZ3500_MvSof-1268-A1-R1_Chr4-1g06660 [Microbotryum saponariae]|uniref:BZ3500_MvSof-1268-A1-R1_Chr4-1g06660 protein n=1 Tax=Microbotryum saponariae TaxID=289078 RepID=A0A2X0MAW9_9BASI|nr:BZ3500_MvSof-1268-A1-R1_Chr4-1g06660 [Microbotryum saponariae]SDA06325.1 BZ3501_MvSof-1269-A2-R1_Chr4-1g06370 [Microbotryum saponariae]
MAAYRGAVVEDLQLSPALVLSSDTTVDVALQMAFEREFSIIPISHPSTRRLQGWLSSQALQTQVGSGLISGRTCLASVLERPNSNSDETTPTASGTRSLATRSATSAVTRFRKEGDYQVITPNTPLEELETFFTHGQTRNVSFALVTDQERKFVLGVVTPDDLLKFISRREPNHKPTFTTSNSSSSSTN